MRIYKSSVTFTVLSSLSMLASANFSAAQQAENSAQKDSSSTESFFRLSQVNEVKQDVGDQPSARVAFNSDADAAPRVTRAPHKLDRAIDMANASLRRMRRDIRDYTGLLVRREQIKGVISDPSYMQMKIRCPRTEANTQVPFSIYMKFLKPREAAGRECIWVDGNNDGKIVAHEAGGLIGMKRFYLEPTGFLAMRESRYPIYDAGIENLIEKLIEKAERDREAGPCGVEYRENGEINGRVCTVIELFHPEKIAPYEFHKAQVFIDNETQLPIRYASFDWPESPSAEPRLIEEYIYLNLKFNVGLGEKDFCADNPSYKFPRR